MEILVIVFIIGFIVLCDSNDSSSYSSKCDRKDTSDHWSPGPSYYRTNERNEWDF